MGSNFRENLRSELNFQGIVVKELSAKTKIPVATLDCYLRTRSTEPSAENAVKIAQALRVSVESLLSGKKAEKEYHPKKICREAREIIRWVESLNAEQCKVILNVIATFRTSPY